MEIVQLEVFKLELSAAIWKAKVKMMGVVMAGNLWVKRNGNNRSFACFCFVLFCFVYPLNYQEPFESIYNRKEKLRQSNEPT